MNTRAAALVAGMNPVMKSSAVNKRASLCFIVFFNYFV
jgi:hypothetical protein